MKRRNFLVALASLIPAVHVVKELLPKKEMVGELGQYNGVAIMIDPANGSDYSCDLITTKDISNIVKFLDQKSVSTPYQYILHEKQIEDLAIRSWNKVI